MFFLKKLNNYKFNSNFANILSIA